MAVTANLDPPVAVQLAGAIMRLYHAIPLNLARPRPTSIKTAYGTLATGAQLHLVPPDLGVDLRSDLVGIVPLLADLPAEEHHLILLAEGERTEHAESEEQRPNRRRP